MALLARDNWHQRTPPARSSHIGSIGPPFPPCTVRKWLRVRDLYAHKPKDFTLVRSMSMAHLQRCHEDRNIRHKDRNTWA